jgi:hypothetical protein
MSASPHSPDIWATATGEEAQLPTIYRYRQNRPHAVDSYSFPFALRVIWPYDGSVRNGMPPVDRNELHIAFEGAIDRLGNGEIGFLMLVFTGNGRKEWLYYVREPRQWTAALTNCLANHEPYPLRIEDWEDADWSTWERFAQSVTGRS